MFRNLFKDWLLSLLDFHPKNVQLMELMIRRVAKAIRENNRVYEDYKFKLETIPPA
jgi:hypothetical protein